MTKNFLTECLQIPRRNQIFPLFFIDFLIKYKNKSVDYFWFLYQNNDDYNDVGHNFNRDTSQSRHYAVQQRA